MNSNDQKEDVQQKIDDSGVDLSRRRLAKVALVGAPVLMSLPGKSALAGNCTTLSGMMSGNLSATAGGGQPCTTTTMVHVSGYSDGYWAKKCNKDDRWSGGYVQKKKCGVFYPTPTRSLGCPAELSERSLLEVLWMKKKHLGASSLCTSEALELTRHTLAACLSAKKDSRYFISCEQAVDIYRSIIANGLASGFYLEPTSGEKLYCADIIDIYKHSYVSDKTSIDGVAFNPNQYTSKYYKYDDTKCRIYYNKNSKYSPTNSDYYRHCTDDYEFTRTYAKDMSGG